MKKRSREVITPEDKRNMDRVMASLEGAMEHIEMLNQDPHRPRSTKQKIVADGGPKQKGPADRMAAAMMRQIKARADHKLVKQNIALTHKLGALLRQTYPHLEGEAVSNIGTSLAEIWVVGVKHRRFLENILAMESNKRKRNLGRELVRMEVVLLYDLKRHLRSFRRGLAALWPHLDKKGPRGR
jgi:hypothetical protein